MARLSETPSISVLNDFFTLTLVYNEGGAMGTSFGSSTYYLVISLLVLPVLLYYIYRHRAELDLAVPLAFISGGAIGNLIDRIRLGRVIDFLDIDFLINRLWGDDRWWTFNIADACISVAIVYLVIRLFFFTRPPAAAAAAANETKIDPAS